MAHRTNSFQRAQGVPQVQQQAAAHNDIEEVERLARVKLSCGIEFANPR